MFRFFLFQADGQVLDTPGEFVTAVPNWTVGETFLPAHGEEYRILEIKTEIADELLEAGFNGILHASCSGGGLEEEADVEPVARIAEHCGCDA
jgi:hypothetical protein